MRARARIHDVADAAGVSVSTVSQALNGQGKISAETRERVRRAATELGYEANRIAAALRVSRTGIVGFVADEIATTPFAGSIVRGAQREAARRGLTLMVVDSDGDPEVERRQIDVLRAQQVDAFIYARMYNQARDVPVAMMEPTPLAVVNIASGSAPVPSVRPDEYGIGVRATRFLLEAGHRSIAHLTITDPGPAVELRAAGYTAAMKAARQPPQVVAVGGPADAIAGRRALQLALQRRRRLTAVFAFNDPMAMGVYQHAATQQVSVPDDLSVIGVDNLEVIAAQLQPALTTLELPHAEMGAWAVRAVADPPDESDSPPAHALLTAPLVVRASVATRSGSRKGDA